LTAAMLKCTRAGLSGQSPTEAGRLRSPWAHCRSSTATSQPTKRNRAGYVKVPVLHLWPHSAAHLCAHSEHRSAGCMGGLWHAARSALSLRVQSCQCQWRRSSRRRQWQCRPTKSHAAVWQLCSIRWRPHHDDTARSQGTLRRGRVPAPCPSRSMGVRASRCTECGGAARVRPS
jgi:hypothetical protein